MPVVVAMRADFPAHCCVLPKGTCHVNANLKQSFPLRHAPMTLGALQQCFTRNTGALIQSSREGALTPRQRPYRHGRNQRASGGALTGTLSIPDVPKGWQRNSRASVIQPPAH